MTAAVIERPPATTDARHALAARVRAIRDRRGSSWVQIAAELGISRSYAGELYADPDGLRAAARKLRYCGTCERCGAATSGSNGKEKAPAHCASCQIDIQHESKFWTRDVVIESIQRWHREHGRPPYSTDWNHADRDRSYPPASAVHRGGSANPSAPFDTWADAIEASGFPRPRVGKRDGQRDWSPEAVAEELCSYAVAGVVVSPPAWLYGLADRYFGGWAAACDAAGVKSWRATHGWTRERVVATLREHADGPLAPRCADLPPYCLFAVRRIFGSWAAAVEAAGLVRVRGGAGTEAYRARLKEQLLHDPDVETSTAVSPRIGTAS